MMIGCTENAGSLLVEVEVAQGLAGGRVLCLAQRLSEPFFEQVFFVFLRLNRLTEQRFFAFFVVAHGLRRGFKIFKQARARVRRMADDDAGLGINPDHRPTVGTGNFEDLFLRLGHSPRIVSASGGFSQWGRAAKKRPSRGAGPSWVCKEYR